MVRTYTIHTLHREKYILCFLILLFAVGGASSLIPLSEIVKIILVLCTIPGILFCSVKISQNPSQWTILDNKLSIEFKHKTLHFDFDNIDHIRCLTRSGGNLYVIYRHKKSTKRYWRNKLFQADDDQQMFHEALLNSPIEFHKL